MPSSPWGILPNTFCGMRDLTADAITSYLHTRAPLLLLTINDDTDRFKVSGFAFPTVICGNPVGSPDPGDRAAICGYAFFRPYWGTPEITILGMLGLSYLFLTLNLQAIHGQRYASNGLTARFMRQFGMTDTGTIPRFLSGQNGYLEPCVVNTLLREDFENYVTGVLTEVGLSGKGRGQ